MIFESISGWKPLWWTRISHWFKGDVNHIQPCELTRHGDNIPMVRHELVKWYALNRHVCLAAVLSIGFVLPFRCHQCKVVIFHGLNPFPQLSCSLYHKVSCSLYHKVSFLLLTEEKSCNLLVDVQVIILWVYCI